jgi:signal transduction histidine kinase
VSRRLRASQWFAIAVGALVFVGVIGTVASVVALNRLSDARLQLADRLDPAAINAAEVLAAMVDQETGVRGYALSGDRGFLAPFNTGRPATRAALDRLDEIARAEDSGQLTADLRAVRATVHDWETQYADVTIRQVESGAEQARDLGAVEAGKGRFDAFREALGTLQSHLVPARAQARERLDSSARTTLLWVLGTGIVVLLSVAGVALTLRGVIVRPLGRLADGARRVSGGEYDHRLEGSGALEVVELGEDVDTMRERIVAELAALAAAQEELKRSNAELEQFAYVASHDLQEPLRKVASFCQLLQQRYSGQLDERADQYIGFAVDGAQRMQALINDLLAFSRVGRMERPHTRVDCTALVARVQEDLAQTIAESGAEVRATGLPPVDGDATLLRLVFQNLIGNAVKFRGEAAPVITIDAERDGEMWRFRCADNGIGIDAEYAERIFVIFQRLHPRSAYEGTGIGLAMCRKIVEYHGGRMWLETDGGRDGPGSSFCFTLPAMAEDE